MPVDDVINVVGDYLNDGLAMGDATLISSVCEKLSQTLYMKLQREYEASKGNERNSLIALYRRMRMLHYYALGVVSVIDSAIRDARLTKEELVDCSYILRQTADCCEDMRKFLTMHSECADKCAAMLWVAEKMQNPLAKSEPIRGNMAVGSPDVSNAAVIPSKKKDPEGYAELLASLGVPQSLVDAGIIRLHWPEFQNWYAELQREGKPTPKGIDPSRSYTQHKMRIQSRKDFDIEKSSAHLAPVREDTGAEQA